MAGPRWNGDKDMHTRTLQQSLQSRGSGRDDTNVEHRVWVIAGGNGLADCLEGCSMLKAWIHEAEACPLERLSITHG